MARATLLLVSIAVLSEWWGRVACELDKSYSSRSQHNLISMTLSGIDDWFPAHVQTVTSPVNASKRMLKFIHIAKTGGTSIEDAGLTKGLKWGRHHNEVGWWHGCFGTKPQSLKERYDWFMVVRNPFARIISEFHCKFGGVGSRARSMSKADFNDWIIHRVKRQRDTVTLDMACGHYTRQFRYLDETVPMSIIHFENLQSEFQELMDTYEPGKFHGLTAHSMRPAAKKFTVFDMNDEVLELIRTFYKEDFQVFGYDFGTSAVDAFRNLRGRA